jgi:hypothetical protein
MLFCSIVSFCIVKAGLVQPVDGMTLDVYKVLRPLPFTSDTAALLLQDFTISSNAAD